MGTAQSKKTIKALNRLDIDEIPDLVNDKAVYARVVDVYDGDTCTIVFLLGKHPIKVKLRFAGIDAAEKPRRKDQSDRTPEEIALCNAATQFVEQTVLGKCVYVELRGWGKYGGRVIGNIYAIDHNGTVVGTSLNDQLLNMGLAVPYNGGNKEDIDWKQIYDDWKVRQNGE
jgi:endonuclease YncB( thermonuclease family)